jgi:hypothetical protein
LDALASTVVTRTAVPPNFICTVPASVKARPARRRLEQRTHGIRLSRERERPGGEAGPFDVRKAGAVWRALASSHEAATLRIPAPC